MFEININKKLNYCNKYCKNIQLKYTIKIWNL